MRLALIALLAAAPLLAADLEFKEAFADPARRAAAVETLVPGSRDWFFYRALQQQLAGDAAGFQKTMTEWKAAAADPKRAISREGWEVLDNRRVLLGYGTDPQASVQELIRKLDLHFDDARPETDAAASLPDRLDPALISAEAFRAEAARTHPNAPWEIYGQAALLAELEHLDDLSEEEVEWLYHHLESASSPHAVALFKRVYTTENPPEFGDVSLEKHLTHDQLEELTKEVPALKASEAMATAWMATLPTREKAGPLDPAALTAHLAACAAYLKDTPETLNSLKANVFYHHLRMQREAGNFPQDVFLAYLRLPREGHPLLLDSKDTENRIDLEGEFSSATGCPAVEDDEQLVGALLEHFLAASETTAAFKDLIEPGRLTRLAARAHLLAGADAAKWSKPLPPAEVQDLQKETRVGFAPGRPVVLGADAAVKLTLDLKNTPALLVRVFEIDLADLAKRDELERLAVDLDVDGLTPHLEKRYTYANPALVVHRESIEMPELGGPGAWLVECVSGNATCRALVRKGSLYPSLEPTAEGMSLRVFNEAGVLQKDAVAVCGPTTLRADPEGVIRLLDGAVESRVGYVQAGRLAATLALYGYGVSFKPEPELRGEMHVDREQLIPNHPATLLLKPVLTNHKEPVPPDRLQQARVVLSATLQGGTKVERTLLQDVKLQAAQEVAFQIPEGTLSMSVTLTGRYAASEKDRASTLTLTKSWTLGRDATNRFTAAPVDAFIAAARFSRDSQGIYLELRGKNGEPCPSKAVTLTFRHADYQPPLKAALRTDARGRISLGALRGIGSVVANGPDFMENSFMTEEADDEITLPGEMRISTGEETRLPLPAHLSLPNPAVKLIRQTITDPRIAADLSAQLKQEGNTLIVPPLPEGLWRLSLADSEVELYVMNTSVSGGMLAAPTVVTEHYHPALPVIGSATVTGDALQIRLAQSSPLTRVAVISRRYLMDRHWAGQVEPGRASAPYFEFFQPAKCEYLLDRRLSDESRYILDRRNAPRFPGAMLPRPGLLVNRWSQEEAKQEKHTGAGGTLGTREDSAKVSSGTASADPFGSVEDSGYVRSGDIGNVDFLARGSTVFYELQPAADGTLSVPMKSLPGGQFIEVIAASPDGEHRVIVPLPASEPELQDRRLTHPLDTTKHYAGVRTATVLPAGKELTVEGVLDSDWRSFSSLREVYQLLGAATPDPLLALFTPLLDWEHLDEKAKLAFLAERGCNEVHLFLARKDRPFFEKYVKPRLLEKREPTVIDDLLLGRDLSGYFKPVAWARLNAAEKALLSQTSPQARARVAQDLSLRWEVEAPAPEQEAATFASTLLGKPEARSTELSAAQGLGSPSLLGKLQQIVIPVIEFDDTTLEEALDFLRLRGRELDVSEQDPSRKGVNIQIVKPGGSDPGELHINTLRLRNVPFLEALRYICDLTRTRFKITDDGLEVSPAMESAGDLVTRIFTLHGEALSDLSDFASSPARLKKYLQDQGIPFPDEATVSLRPPALVVKSTPSALDLLEQLVSGEATGADEPVASPDIPGLPPLTASAASNIVTGGLRSGYGVISRNNIDAVLNQPAPRNSGELLRLQGRPDWEADRDKTRVWKEQNYYRYRGEGGESFIPLNGFWLDLAKWNGEGAFLSPHFNECTYNLSEALLALAVLDLPADAPAPETRVEGNTLRIKPATPMLLFARETRETGNPEADASVLVRQTFYRLDDHFRQEGSRRVENTVSGDFVAGVPYGMTLVVTNPSGSSRRLDLLAQIPAGAIPLRNRPATLSASRELDDYGVLNEELAFYFPLAGTYPVYPLHVADGEKLLAVTPVRALTVAANPAAADAKSWPELAREGTADAVLERLRSVNLHRLDLRPILWRLHDRSFFNRVMEIFRDRMFSDSQVASYALLHGEAAEIRTALENTGLVKNVGGWLDSPLLEVHRDERPEARITDFDPLVNPRAHAFGEYPRLSHPAALAAYEALLDQLAWKPALSDDDRLALCLSLLSQDRVEEALKDFDGIDTAKLTTHLQYDYAHAVVLFFRKQPEQAREIAAKHLDGPQELWVKRFRTVVEQADEIARLAKGGVKEDAEDQAGTEPSLELTMTAEHQLQIESARLKDTELRFYQIDLEMLFSKNPFLSTDGGDLPQILPNEVQKVALDPSGKTLVTIPDGFSAGNVLISASSGEAQALRILDSPALTVTRQTAQRTLQVTDTATHLPLPETYVKVYAMGDDGEPVFHKDGYTDLRGKFDYLTHTGVEVSNIRKLAILTVHPEKGARVEIIDL
ncbi:MAG: hypothetical protein JWO82_2612 [Akkermansiaceae bacterium]|nr:hypothetical protein [Akkermansiaceae bacterium]